MSEPITPTLRYAARAIVIDDAGRTLLFRAAVPGREKQFIWITTGGGLNEGELEPDCVRREVFEETGLAECEIGPCVWRRDQTFPWGEDMVIRQIEGYYIVRVPAFEVNIEGQEELERAFLSGHRWFTLEELRAHEEVLAPANFAELIEPLLAGQYPPEPITVGR